MYNKLNWTWTRKGRLNTFHLLPSISYSKYRIKTNEKLKKRDFIHISFLIWSILIKVK